MNKKLLLIVGGLIIIAIIAFVALVTLRPEPVNHVDDTSAPLPNEMSSDDGAIKLDISDSALPDGLSREDIQIKKLSPEELFPDEMPRDNFIGFNLEPNGAIFDEPIPFTLTLPLINNRVPLLFHITDDSFDIINDAKVKFTANGDEVVVTGTIDHFSRMAADLAGAFEVIPSPGPGEYEIGIPFKYEFTINPVLDDPEYGPRVAGRRYYYYFGDSSSYQVNPDNSHSIAFIHQKISPDRISLPSHLIGAHDSYSVSHIAACIDEPGDTALFYPTPGLPIEFTVILEESMWTPDGDRLTGKTKQRRVRTLLDYDQQFKCKPSQRPIGEAPSTELKIEVRGLEGLKNIR